jgi:hypothetical protein
MGRARRRYLDRRCPSGTISEVVGCHYIAVEQSAEQNPAYRHRNGGRFQKRRRPSAFVTRNRFLPRSVSLEIAIEPIYL